MKALKGTGVALVTPFASNLTIDFNALERLVSHCIEGGVEYLVVMGTTGENSVLSATEKQAVLKAVVEANAGRVPLVYGLGGNNTSAVVSALQTDDLSGVDAILSVSPYYSKPTQEGIYQHYKLISENSPLPVILYNVPSRTGSNVSAATVLRIAHDFKNVVAVKEASGDLEQVMAIIKDRPAGFLVLSGEDSVSGQAFPAIFTEMIRQSLAGEMATARNLHYRLFSVTQMLFAEGNPGGVKAALDILEIIPPFMRQPLWPISHSLRSTIEAEIITHSL
jgi:4-hydroxy-tetrahydrodipicolinate synthase